MNGKRVKRRPNIFKECVNKMFECELGSLALVGQGMLIVYTLFRECCNESRISVRTKVQFQLLSKERLPG
jgi:hypothetical protein